MWGAKQWAAAQHAFRSTAHHVRQHRRSPAPSFRQHRRRRNLPPRDARRVPCLPPARTASPPRTPSPSVRTATRSTRSPGCRGWRTPQKLPFSLKVLLENLVRTEDGANITADHIRALANWDPEAQPDIEIQFTPARVIMQDFTGVPCVVDLATMREAMADLGGDADKINPLAPAEMVIDHSVIADVFGRGGRLRAQRRTGVRAQPRALPVPALGPDGVRRVQGGPAGYRDRAPGQHRVPGQRGDARGSTGSPTRTAASAPTRTPRWSTASACSAGASAASRRRRPCSASRCPC